MKTFSKENSVGLSYMGLVVVLLVWGSAPLVATVINTAYTPALSMAIRGFVAFTVLFLFSIKKLKNLNKKYFLVAGLTGLFYSVASILQRIGLKTTTPSHYQFLENLSCLIVPFLMWWFVKRKPNFLTIISAVVCLISALILCGFDFTVESLRFGTGDILCAAAGILFGVNIAGTGAFSKELDPFLYVMIQQFVLFICGTAYTVFLGFSGTAINYDLSFKYIAILITEAVFISAFCWILRTVAMKYVNATIVSVIMPLTAVVTVVLSVIFISEKLTLSLILGGVLGLLSVYLSVLGDIKYKKQEQAIEKKG